MAAKHGPSRSCATDGEINKWAFHPTNPNIVYHSAAKNRGVFKSTDGGKTWKQVLKGYGRCVSICKTNPNILYSSRFKSTDGGETWQNVGGGSAWAVAIHPKNPDIVYKATQGDGVFMTTNGGKVWWQMNGLTRGGPTDLTAHWAIAIDGENDILYVGAAVPYKATHASDPEATLHEASKGVTSTYAKSLAGTKDVLWVGTNGQGVNKSTDHGRTWQRKLLGLRGKLNLGALQIHPKNHDIIYSAGEGGLVKTTNGGDIWIHMPQPGSVHGVVPDPQDVNGVFTVCGGTLYVSRDGGFHWQPWEPLNGRTITAFRIHPTRDDAYLARTKDNQWLRSLDGGKSWTTFDVPVNGNLVISARRKRRRRFTFIAISRAPGKAPMAAKTGSRSLKAGASALAEAPDGTVWLGDSGAVHRSTDGGRTWQHLDVPTWVQDVMVDPNNPAALFAATQGGLFWIAPQTAELPPAPPEQGEPTMPEAKTLEISKAGILDRANTTYKLTQDISAQGTAFYVIANNITIDGQGHTVTFQENCVQAIGVNKLAVKHIKATQTEKRTSSHGVGNAFDFKFCDDSSVTDCTISTAHRGCAAVSIQGDRAKIANNAVTHLGDFCTAISVSGSKPEVRGNDIDATSSSRAMAVSRGSEAVIADNKMRFGGPTPVSGMTLTLCNKATITGNELSGNARGGGSGLELNYSNELIVTDNKITIADNGTSDVIALMQLKGCDEAQVKNNTFVSKDVTGYDIVLRDSDDNVFTGNDVDLADDGRAILAEDAVKNRFPANNWHGLSLQTEGVVKQLHTSQAK